MICIECKICIISTHAYTFNTGTRKEAKELAMSFISLLQISSHTPSARTWQSTCSRTWFQTCRARPWSTSSPDWAQQFMQ